MRYEIAFIGATAHLCRVNAYTPGQASPDPIEPIPESNDQNLWMVLGLVT